jgi:hypothetical protein
VADGGTPNGGNGGRYITWQDFATYMDRHQAEEREGRHKRNNEAQAQLMRMELAWQERFDRSQAEHKDEMRELRQDFGSLADRMAAMERKAAAAFGVLGVLAFLAPLVAPFVQGLLGLPK